RTQTTDIWLIFSRAGRKDVKTCHTRQLNCIGAHISSATVNKNCLASGRFSIFEQHLPCSYSDYGNGSGLEMIDATWFRSDLCGRSNRILCIGSAKIVIRHAIYLFTASESGNAGPNLFDEARKV